MTKLFLFFARALFSLTFLISGVNALLNWSDGVSKFNAALCQWQAYIDSFPYMKDLLWYGASNISLLIGVAMFLEIVGGLLFLINYKMRLGVFFLLLFFIAKTVIFHPFWLETGEAFYAQATLFVQHLSIIGALLYFLIGPRESKKDSTNKMA